ncbi:MAG: radical SAM protein [Acidobacteriota bacterium]
MKTVFGPVPSRRLGRSLGIDVIPPKTCSHDCVYCESGRTTHLSVERRAFVDPAQVMRDLESYFAEYPQGADVLTFSSAGEPTLYEPMRELLRDVKKRFPSLPLIVLTNGSLLWDPRVREDLMTADVVAPSLNAATPEVYRAVNRPHPSLGLTRVLEGLEAFSREYRGHLHVEVMLVRGLNDHAEELTAIRRIVDRLAPRRVELNTVVRPPADPDVRGLSSEAMQEAEAFFPAGLTRVIGTFKGSGEAGSELGLKERVLRMVRRRPCTAEETAESLGVRLEDLQESLTELESSGKLVRSRFDGREFLRLP